MATKHAVFTFALPEDADSDFIRLYDSDTETGSYSQVGSDIAYDYGDTTYEFEDINESKWYKIQFYNSTDDQLGPLSEATNGSNFSDRGAPFLAVSTRTDGAFYASTQDVYDYSGLTTSDITNARVSQALRRSRAIIDLRTAEMGLDRFTNIFDTDTSRKKYNASLRVVKEAEICFALSMAYRGMADDKIMDGIRGTDTGIFESVSIGESSISQDTGAMGSRTYVYLTGLSVKYGNIAAALLSMLMPSSVVLKTTEPGALPWYPFGWKAVA